MRRTDEDRLSVHDNIRCETHDSLMMSASARAHLKELEARQRIIPELAKRRIRRHGPPPSEWRYACIVRPLGSLR